MTLTIAEDGIQWSRTEINGGGERSQPQNKKIATHGEGVAVSDGVMAVTKVVADGDHLAASTREINTKIRVPDSTRGGLLQLLVGLCTSRQGANNLKLRHKLKATRCELLQLKK